MEKINDLIRDHLAEIINREVDLSPGIFISISKVDTSADLRYAKALVSVFPEKNRATGLKVLKKNLYQIQGALNQKLHCKPLPKIVFISDETEKRADELEQIFKKIKTERK
ncbi:MAG TPA: ribosome-binding factor A [Candidatus Moranbacteria bacterium]|nr:ribosome-binding factor A [Candidatus Moranbacteria bacterium]